MATSSLNCSNCGAPLEIQEGVEFVVCQYCESTNQIKTLSDGRRDTQIMSRVQGNVEEIRDRTEGMAEFQRRIAQRENARADYDDLKEEHEAFQAWYHHQFMPSANLEAEKNRRRTKNGVALIIIGVLLLFIFIGIFFIGIGIWLLIAASKSKGRIALQYQQANGREQQYQNSLSILRAQSRARL